jgi:glycerophosphoryl diester phosphodiesterase
MSGRAGPNIAVWPTLRVAGAVITRHIADYLVAILIVQVLVLAVALPALAGLLQVALDAVGVPSITTISIGVVLSNPLADLIIVVLIVIAGFFVYLELATLLVITHRHRRGQPVSVRSVFVDVWRASKRLVHPSSLLLLPYFFLVLPLGNIGIGTVLTQSIRIPSFVTGELLKSPSGAWLYGAVIAALIYLSVRLVLTLSVFVSSEANVGQAIWASWRMTRWQALRLLVMLAVVAVLSAVLVSGVLQVGIIPTRWADGAMPAIAVWVAGVSFAMMTCLSFFIGGLTVAMLTNIIVESQRVRAAGAPGTQTEADVAANTASVRPAAPRSPLRRVVLTASAVIAFLLLGVAGTTVVAFANDSDETLVIAHRGLVSGGVENTIPALEAAAAVHPDLVEIDVQYTKDSQFIVMHDTGLGRLAGINKPVGSMTLAELEKVTLTQGGHTAPIPSLTSFIDRAKELGVNLLIELKPRGDEDSHYLDNFISIMEQEDVLDSYYFHSLSQSTIEEFNARLPSAYAGYIVPINLGHAPITSADFVVIEEGSFSSDLQETLEGQGLGVMVWTVEDPDMMRQYIRDDVTAIITDQPQQAELAREDINDDDSASSRLKDALSSIGIK